MRHATVLRTLGLFAASALLGACAGGSREAVRDDTPTQVLAGGVSSSSSSSSGRPAPVPLTELELSLAGPAPEVGELLEAWSQNADPARQGPLLTRLGLVLPEEGFRTGDLDGDGFDEWLAVVRSEPTSTPVLWVVGLDGRIVELEACQPFFAPWQACEVVATGELTGSGGAEVVTRLAVMGAHTEVSLFRVYGSTQPGQAPQSLVVGAPQSDGTVSDAAEMPSVTRSELRDPDGDGVLELVLEGGHINSAGAGEYQRTRREVWRYVGERIVRVEEGTVPSTLRIHVLWDANDALARGDVAHAAQLYTLVLEHEGLDDVSVDGREVRPLVMSFAAFRLALLALEQGDAVAAGRWRDWLAQHDATGAWARAATLLVDAWSGDRAVACAQVTAQLQGEKVSWLPLSDMGYANPALDADDVCPLE